MDKLALDLPNYPNIGQFPGMKPEVANANAGSLVSQSLTVVFMLAGLMMFIWAAVGIFQYISSGGNKEGLAKARARITWSIVGFVFILASFVLTKYVQELLNPNLNTPLTEVTEPKK